MLLQIIFLVIGQNLDWNISFLKKKIVVLLDLDLPEREPCTVLKHLEAITVKIKPFTFT